MSIERNIEGSDNVFQYEQKDLIIPVGDTLNPDGTVSGAVDLTQFADIEYVVRHSRHGPAVIRKTVGDGEIVIEDAPGSPVSTNDAARVGIDSADLGIPPGTYFHMLRELDGNNVLIHGRFVLQAARDPAAVPA